MADLSFLKTLNKPIAILGLGVSGSAVAQACIDAGVPFHAWDDNVINRGKVPSEYMNDFSGDVSQYAFLVPSAGIKPSHPIIQKFDAIRSDVDLLVESAPDATFIAITGTNGKSTTTALIGHILEQAGLSVAVGGNIGKAACSLPTLGKGGFYVLELSSYMLEITANPMADIAVLLNITPDHLDWHGTMDHYVAAKQKIFRQRESRPAQIAVYGRSMAASAQEWPALPEHPFLKGVHNQENIYAAMDACRAAGLDDDTIFKHLMTFEGLSHRQKKVGQRGDILFINDSKATNADATSKALASYDEMYWIVGGMPKSDGLNGLDVYYPKIKHAYLIGQASEAFAKTLDGHVPTTTSGTMKNAVAQAYADAKQNGGHAVVLLSPACASFDQYQNFEQRGDDFTACVNALLQE